MMRLFCIILTSLICLQSSSKERPNIIIIMTDDQGYGDLSCKENPGNCFWTVFAREAGTYEFELLRWPREANAAILSNIPGRFNKSYVSDLPKGKALMIESIELKISDSNDKVLFSETQNLDATDKSKTFKCDLEKGSYVIQSYCHLTNGQSIGAYYMYVSKI